MQNTMADLPKTLLRTKFTGYSGNPIDYLDERLHDLQLKRQDLLSKYTEKSQLVQEACRQIDEIQALLKKEDATRGQVTQLALLVEKATLAELHAKDAALKGELAEARNELKSLNENEIKLAQLQREIEIQTANYRNYADKLEQARIDRALEMGRISNISVVQPSTFPVKPIRPRKALNLALGCFLGVFGGLGMAFLAEHLDHSFKTPIDVERVLQLPVLTIPLVHRDGHLAALEEKNLASVPKYQLMLGITVNTKECQAIINQLLLSGAEARKTRSVFAVTSCLKEEGASSLAVSLAISLASHTRGRILLVDANLEYPSIHQIFGVNRWPGFADILGTDQLNTHAIQPSFLHNLDLMTAGNGEPLELIFDLKPFADLLSLWRREYNFVIFDTPPLAEGSAEMGLTQLADGVILVVEAERTRWEVVQRAKEMLTKAQVDILGVVLNKRRFPIPEWLYKTL
jgi:capsular exopolysaccharide synthesis family protein